MQKAAAQEIIDKAIAERKRRDSSKGEVPSRFYKKERTRFYQ